MSTNKNIIVVGGSEEFDNIALGMTSIDSIIKKKRISKTELIVYGYAPKSTGAFVVAKEWATKNGVIFRDGNPKPKEHNEDWKAALASRNKVLAECSKLLINLRTKSKNGGTSFVESFEALKKPVEVIKDYEEVDTSSLTPVQRRKGEIPSSEDVEYSVKIYSGVAQKLLNVGAIMLDVESTGVSVTDEVIDIAIADCNSGLVLFNSYIKTDVPISAGATKANGITQKMLDKRSKGAPTINEVWEDIEKLVGNKIVVSSHSNSGVKWFDERIINQSLRKYNKTCSFLWVDLQPLYRMYSCQLDESKYGLRTDGMCLQLGVEAGTHAAKEDVLAQIRILQAMARGVIPNFDV